MSLLTRMRKARQAVQPVAPNNEEQVVTSAHTLPANNAYTLRFFKGFNNILLRSFMDESGVIWFVAQDFMKILEYPEYTWQDPAIRKFFTSVPQNYTQVKPVVFKQDNDEYKVEELYCVNEHGARIFLDLIWQPAVKPVLMLIDADIIPFFRHITVVREFDWQGYPIRTTRDTSHKIWFVFKDVLKALGYSEGIQNNPGRLTQSLLDSAQQGMIDLPASNSHSVFFCIREDGLEAFLNRNTKPNSHLCKEWVATEVLPVWEYKGTIKRPKCEPPLPVSQQDEKPPTATEEWDKVALAPATNDPKVQEHRIILALRASREQEGGGVNTPMWIAAGQTMTLEQLVTVINSYWLERNLTKPQLVQWFRQHGFLETASINSNMPTMMARQKGVFAPYTYMAIDPQSKDAHLRADVNITDVGVGYFTTLCVQGEQFEPKPY